MENRQRQGISLTSGRIGSDKLKIFLDAADFKLMSLNKKGDICVTQDYGAAAMILGKGAVTI